MATPGRSYALLTRWGDSVFLAVTTCLFVGNLYLILEWAPTERVMGIVQRLFYLHVPLVWTGFLGFAIVFAASIAYALKRTDAWDLRARAAGEVGLLFVTLGIVTGAIWGKPVWGTWWTWDAKLTTTFILWMVYLGYLMVRAFAPTRDQAARYAAVIGIIGFAVVPLVYMASAWWETLHPELVIGPLVDTGGLEDQRMSTVLQFSLVSFTLLFALLFRQRVGQIRNDNAVEALSRMKADA